MGHPARSAKLLRVGSLKLTLESNGQLRFDDREGLPRIVYQADQLFERLAIELPRAIASERISHTNSDHNRLLRTSVELGQQLKAMQKKNVELADRVAYLEHQLKEKNHEQEQRGD